MDEIDTVITDWGIDEECVEKIKKLGKKLIVAKKLTNK